jgi:hypothetical protein
MSVPEMEDMATLAKVGQMEPAETSLRIEMVRRELGLAIQKNPGYVVDFVTALERNRSQLERQVKAALRLLGERQGEIDQLKAELAARPRRSTSKRP